MSAPFNHDRRVIPACLSSLAIFNPTLGPRDEITGEQILYYYSAKDEENSEKDRAEKGNRKTGEDQNAARLGDSVVKGQVEDQEDAEQNKRLRQVGLAQGMVDFVKNFSNGVPLESIETEKSRVVLKEVEPSWWILATINLTKLPPTSSTSSSRTTTNVNKGRAHTKVAADPVAEYSSREVAPAQLLLSQLIQAHRGFLLHHGPSLSELWKKIENKTIFCGLLNRYWTQFCRSWHVLLHGNPAVELYDGLKLAGAGELGIGVGEEEWGSGEREVLEDFAGRTEGLVDLIVGRYGDAPPPRPTEQADVAGDHKATSRTGKDRDVWLGQGESSRAQDGIIFSGIDGILKRSVITISQWIENIFVHGEAAYGVGENPASRPRGPRRRRKAKSASRRTREEQRRRPDPGRKTSEHKPTPPGIPPPLVATVDTSTDTGRTGAAKQPEPNAAAEDQKDPSTTGSNNSVQQGSLIAPETMMKYISLGYGSSWTLNPKGFASDDPIKQHESKIISKQEESTAAGASLVEGAQQSGDNALGDVDEGSEEHLVQRMEESIGRFLIGLSGDLEGVEFEDELDKGPDDGSERHAGQKRATATISDSSRRIFLRTLTVEMSHPSASSGVAGDKTAATPQTLEALARHGAKTSAASSVDGSHPIISHQTVQVVVYAHQPFIFVFLFRLHTTSLGLPAFYRKIHHTLGPLQKSLLRSTDVNRWRQRVKEALDPGSLSVSVESDTEPARGAAREAPELYDFIFDPEKLTIRTSVPNIPVPGSLAAEGLHQSHRLRPVTVSGSWYTLGIPFGSNPASGTASPTGAGGLVKSAWTRIEALSVHSHLMNLWAVTREPRVEYWHAQPKPDEKERSVKTSRGWWVVWMRVEPQDYDDAQAAITGKVPKEAYLVRRALQEYQSGRDASGTRNESRNTSSSGRWLLREQPRSREVSGLASSVATGGDSTTAKGVGQGVGVDARKWVEGLIRLSM
ncbi:hypothetical protein PV10_08696 [Exophiala mesophila]|uniref:CCZ1/INTU/HSP4 first Longin domain-containing protein n=1 Tax=Exophiala mesophila TaxID=212818 RepID=A0A0D1XLN8_EXOME|nr:uncharacterized protein PV10_08696 [Exophiala mesophila]KIV89091.1 hypothetical protein PV10_08696 [Exophiala mesophila]